MAITPDGKYAVTSAHWDAVRVWDLDAGMGRPGLRDDGSVLSATVASDGTHTAVRRQDRTLWISNLMTGQEQLLARDFWWTVSAIAVTRDGRHAILGCGNGMVWLWDLATGDGRDLVVSRTSVERVNEVVLTPDGQRAVTADNDGTVRVWDLTDGSEVSKLTGHGRDGYFVAVTPDGRHVVTATKLGLRVAVVDLAGALAPVVFQLLPGNSERSGARFALSEAGLVVAQNSQVMAVDLHWEALRGRG